MVQSQPSNQKIQEFYDVVSPLYRDLWASHIHHGYFPTGSESKEEATEELIKVLAEVPLAETRLEGSGHWKWNWRHIDLAEPALSLRRDWDHNQPETM